MEKTLQIDWEGKKEEVIIKEVTYGEKNRIIKGFTDIKQTGSTVDPYEMRTLWLEKAIIKAPFEVNRKNIDDLSARVGDYLFEEITKLNSVSEKKDETSGGQ